MCFALAPLASPSASAAAAAGRETEAINKKSVCHIRVKSRGEEE